MSSQVFQWTFNPAGEAPTLDGRWYAADSPWNKPIPDSPSLHADSADMRLGFKYTANMASSAERQTVRLDGATTNPYSTNSYLFSLAYSGVPSVWIPPGGTSNVTVDIIFAPCGRTRSVPLDTAMDLEHPAQITFDNAAVMMLDDGAEWNFYKLAKPTWEALESTAPCFSRTNSGSQWSAVIAESISGGWEGQGYDGGALTYRESGTNAGGGMVRIRDFQQPAGSSWDHAIAIVGGPISKGAHSGGGDSTTIHPANVPPFSHGTGDNNWDTMKTLYCIPYGARIQFDPSIDFSHLNQDGSLAVGTGDAPEWKKQYCRTMQTYGAYVVDSNSTPDAATSGPAPPWTTVFQYPYQDFYGLNGFESPGTDDVIPKALYTHIRVLDWDDPDNY